MGTQGEVGARGCERDRGSVGKRKKVLEPRVVLKPIIPALGRQRQED
jgi:hypothetical protein